MRNRLPGAVQRPGSDPRPEPVRGIVAALTAAAALPMLAGCAAAPEAAGPMGAGAVAMETSWRARFPGADSVRVASLEPGVEHVYLWLGHGPWAVHVLEIERGVCGPVVAAIKAGPPLDARAPTSELAASALAGINADFFMIPGGTPVGAAVRAGRVLAGPATRPVLGIDGSGEPVAGVARVDGWVATRGDTAAVARVNRTGSDTHHPERPGIVYLDEWYGAPVPDTGITVRVRRIPSGSGNGGAAGPDRNGWGRAGSGRVGPDRGVVVPGAAGDVILRGAGPGALAWLARRAPGDTVTWTIDVVVSEEPVDPGRAADPAADPTAGSAGREGRAVRVAEAVGGFPVLVADGAGVYAEPVGVPESFGDARHPRTAVGWNPERYFWVVVDGRQVPYSDGMTLAELERLFLRLGATDAINLDGGGSTAMVVRGRVANRPSDASGERPVGNALVLERCAGPGSAGGG